MPLSTRSSLNVWVIALACVGAPGCLRDLFPQSVTSGNGSSQVAQGRYYSTGNPEYDEFFLDLHHLQVELKDAPERIAEPRRALADTLDVGIDAEEIRVALAKRASELEARKVKLDVVRPASADKPYTLRVTGAVPPPDLALQKSLEETLAKVSEHQHRIGEWHKHLGELPGRAKELESGVDTALGERSSSQRDEVRANLADASKILAILDTRAKDAERSNSELLAALVAGLGEAEPAAEPEASEPKQNGKKSPPNKATPPKKAQPPAPKPERPRRATPPPPAPKPVKAKPAPPAPKPAAKPEPKPEPKAEPKPERSEVPPAPKPTQGTAKPDFEP